MSFKATMHYNFGEAVEFTKYTEDTIDSAASFPIIRATRVSPETLSGILLAVTEKDSKIRTSDGRVFDVRLGEFWPKENKEGKLPEFNMDRIIAKFRDLDSHCCGSADEKFNSYLEQCLKEYGNQMTDVFLKSFDRVDLAFALMVGLGDMPKEILPENIDIILTLGLRSGNLQIMNGCCRVIESHELELFAPLLRTLTVEEELPEYLKKNFVDVASELEQMRCRNI